MKRFDQQTPVTDYPNPRGHYSHITGKREPWVRCVFCQTHVLKRENTANPICDCGATSWIDGNIGVNRV